MTTAIDWTGREVVESVPERLSGVPVLKGTRLQADSVVENARDGMSAAEIADMFEVPEDRVRAVIEYAAAQRQAAARKRRRGLSPVR